MPFNTGAKWNQTYRQCVVLSARLSAMVDQGLWGYPYRGLLPGMIENNKRTNQQPAKQPLNSDLPWPGRNVSEDYLRAWIEPVYKTLGGCRILNICHRATERLQSTKNINNAIKSDGAIGLFETTAVISSVQHCGQYYSQQMLYRTYPLCIMLVYGTHIWFNLLKHLVMAP